MPRVKLPGIRKSGGAANLQHGAGDTRNGACTHTLLPISSGSSCSFHLFHSSERGLCHSWALLVARRILDKESEKVKEGAPGSRRRRRGEQEKEGFSVSTRELKRFY